jgi:hypothetical protein
MAWMSFQFESPAHFIIEGATTASAERNVMTKMTANDLGTLNRMLEMGMWDNQQVQALLDTLDLQSAESNFGSSGKGIARRWLVECSRSPGALRLPVSTNRRPLMITSERAR